MKPSSALLSALAFLAVGVVINVALVVGFERGIASRTGEAERERAFETFDGPVRVLAIGASHSIGGFDTRLTDDAYVYANAGEAYPSIFVRLVRALDRHPEITHVIAPVGPYYFERHDGLYPVQWMGWPEVQRYRAAGGDAWGYLKSEFRRVAFPYAGKHQKSWDWLHGVGAMEDRNEPLRGFHPSFHRMEPEKMDESAEEVVATHYTGATDPLQAYYLERIAALCAERGIALTLVEWPVSDEYLRLASGRFDPAVQEAAVAAVQRHRPAEVVDLRRLFAGRGDIFGNADHINATGAYTATRLILERAGLPIRAEVTAPMAPPAHLRRRGTAAYQ